MIFVRWLSEDQELTVKKQIGAMYPIIFLKIAQLFTTFITRKKQHQSVFPRNGTYFRTRCQLNSN